MKIKRAKYLFLLLIVTVIAGCATTPSIWNEQRQRLNDARARGEISGDAYYAELNRIEANERAEDQALKQRRVDAIRQMSALQQQKEAKEQAQQIEIIGKHKSFSVYNSDGSSSYGTISE